MDSVILAGGLGTRLREVVPDVPKPLAQINGTPFLDLLFDQLSQFKEITAIYLAIGYKAEAVVERYQAKNNCHFLVEKEPLGTGGALRAALEKVKSEDVLVLNGDSYLEFELPPLLEFHRMKGSVCTIVTIEVPDVSRYGALNVDPQGKIVSFHEKSEVKGKGLVNGGVYILKKELLNHFPIDTPFSLERDFFPELLEKRAFSYSVSGKFIDIGTKESYQDAQEILKWVTKKQS